MEGKRIDIYLGYKSGGVAILPTRAKGNKYVQRNARIKVNSSEDEMRNNPKVFVEKLLFAVSKCQ